MTVVKVVKVQGSDSEKFKVETSHIEYVTMIYMALIITSSVITGIIFSFYGIVTKRYKNASFVFTGESIDLFNGECL